MLTLIYLLVIVGTAMTLLEREPLTWLVPIGALLLGIMRYRWWWPFLIGCFGMVGLAISEYLKWGRWLGQEGVWTGWFGLPGVFTALVLLALVPFWIGRLIRRVVSGRQPAPTK